MVSAAQVSTKRRNLGESTGCPARPVPDVPHHSSIPPFHSQAPLAGTWAVVVQNKANLQRAEMNANCESGNELGGNHRDYACGKTKPIVLARL